MNTMTLRMGRLLSREAVMARKGPEGAQGLEASLGCFLTVARASCTFLYVPQSQEEKIKNN